MAKCLLVGSGFYKEADNVMKIELSIQDFTTIDILEPLPADEEPEQIFESIDIQHAVQFTEKFVGEYCFPFY